MDQKLLAARRRNLLVDALRRLKGDTTQRMRIAIRNMSPAERDTPCPLLGTTFPERLKVWEERDREIDAALEWVATMPDEHIVRPSENE